MAKTGRPAGRMIHAEGFEALLVARNLLKKDVCADSGISPGMLTDLLAHRAGASEAKVEALCRTLGVRPAALFPEISGWVSPLPNRKAKRTPPKDGGDRLTGKAA